MLAKILFLLTSVLALVWGHPTIYKLNENSQFEPVLVAVSSTVIPLPIYHVDYGIKVGPSSSTQQKNAARPEGPITLQTATSKKKPFSIEKLKQLSASSLVKEVQEQEFDEH